MDSLSHLAIILIDGWGRVRKTHLLTELICATGSLIHILFDISRGKRICLVREYFLGKPVFAIHIDMNITTIVMSQLSTTGNVQYFSLAILPCCNTKTGKRHTTVSVHIIDQFKETNPAVRIVIVMLNVAFLLSLPNYFVYFSMYWKRLSSVLLLYLYGHERQTNLAMVVIMQFHFPSRGRVNGRMIMINFSNMNSALTELYQLLLV